MDTAGGNNFQLIGTTQFLSVPYALNSEHANQTNSENWQYYGKENWVNSSLTKDISNLPVHDFWMLFFNLQFSENNPYISRHVTLSLNNVHNQNAYLIKYDNSNQYSDYLILFSSGGNFHCFGSIILDGKHSNGIKLIRNNNYLTSDFFGFFGATLTNGHF